MTNSSHRPHFRTWLSQHSDEELETLLRHRPDAAVPPPPGIAPLSTRLLLRNSISRALARCNAAQLAALRDIAERGGELEEVTDTQPDITAQLKERGLAFGEVMIPKEVMPALPQLELNPEPSGRQGTPTAEKSVDDAGAAAGLAVVRDMQRVLSSLGDNPKELLKDKTLGVRPASQLAKELQLSDAHLRHLLCLGLGARLLGRGEPEGFEGNYLAPTEAAQDWLDLELGEQWQHLLEGWKHSHWIPWGEEKILSPQLQHPQLVAYRRTVLAVYAHSAEALSPEQFREDLAFSSPIFAALTPPEIIEGLREEAEWIGAVAQGRPTAILLEGVDAAPRLTPETVNGFIMQNDMTVLVPGPLPAEIHKQLEAVADLESPGLASVYRISEASLRRGFDYGYTAAEIHEFFTTHSPEVPQTVSYYIDEVSQRHGTLRAGPALSYLRSQDPALLEMACHALPELRRLADTVAISDMPTARLLNALREAGFSPAAEDASGASLNVAPEPATVPTPSPRRTKPAPDIAAAVQAIRRSNAPAPAEVDLDLVQAAARGQREVRIGYANKNGETQFRTVTPLSVSGGQVDAHTADGATLRFPLHRITSVELKED
ncbi:helicase-associated domain-containing protein [Corynebacterium camporealensis]